MQKAGFCQPFIYISDSLIWKKEILLSRFL